MGIRRWRARRLLAPLAITALTGAAITLPTTAAAAAVVPLIPVPALVETTPTQHTGDTADDPAIWVDTSDPSQSLVIGNDKGGALETYGLDGGVVQRITGAGSWGNVDVRQGVTVAGTTADVVAYYHADGVQFARVDAGTRQLASITQGNGISVNGEGLCLYHPSSGELYVFVVAIDGTVRQFLVSGSNGLLTGQLVRTFAVGSAAEGCEADDSTGALYVSEEGVALWRYAAAPTADTTRTAVDRVVTSGGRLAPDIEGITSVRRSDGTGVLIVSAQNVAQRSDSYFAVYDLDTNAYLRSFRVVDGSTADDCDGTDGVAATPVALNSTFPNGLFVCQDNNNDVPGTAGNQNFKYADLAVALAPPSGTAPQAAIQVGCVGLTCSFDGSGSYDSDGTVTSYGWDFGDQTTGSGAQVSHTFASSGTYQVRLTVTDDSGLTGSTTRQVLLGTATGTVSFVGAATAQANSRTARVTVPSSVQSGDTLLLFASSGAAVTTAPPGWTAVATQASSPLTTTLWRRQATTSDAGSVVSASFASLAKYTLTLAAYRGLDGTDPIAAQASAAAGSGTTRTTPTVTSPVAGWVASYWADRSSSTTAWTGPASGVARAAVYGTGGGRVTSLLADSAATVPAGQVGGLTATTNQSGSRATTWTVVLRGAGSVAQTPPTAVIAFGCEARVCQADGTGSFDSDGNVVSYAWTFGDGDTGTGPMPSHTYAQAGHYTVALTVTDDDGLTGTTSQPVDVTDTPPPPAAPVARLSVSCQQLTCQANGSTSSDTDGQITDYSWDFGDGQTGSGASVQHTYGEAGTYTVRLTVTDNDGLTDSATATAAPTTPSTTTTGAPATMGDNAFGQLGDGTTAASRLTPGAVGLNNVTQIAGGREHVLALTADGRVFTWGSNELGQLGLGLATGVNRNSPTEVSGLPPIKAVATGHYHSLALTADGHVWTWGNNASGQLGDGTTTQRNSPVQVSLTDVVSIAAGRDMSYAIRSDGTLWAWGLNSDGELGDGTTTSSSTPQQVPSLSGVAKVAGGRDHGLAILDDGTVWAWGDNEFGQLGDGTTTDRPTPVQIATGWRAVIAGAQHSYGLRADGQVVAFGRNYRHELGDGTTTDRTTPVAVTGVTNAVAIGAGRDHGLAVMADGSVMTWGYNAAGQLGNGTTADAATAFTVAGISGAFDVAGGALYSVVLASGTIAPPPTNQPPTAVASVSCQQLTCTADGTGSTDTDGSIASYSWDFGDGSGPETGATASHTYTAEGTYTVTLTVTDSGGLTDTDTKPAPASGPPPASSITFVGAVGSTANSTSASVTLPSTVTAGDGLVAILSVASTAPTLTPPAGWTLVSQATTSSIRTAVYRHTATAGDAGSAARFTLSAMAKTALQVAAYRGVGSGSFVTVAFQAESGSGTVRTAPAVNIATAGSWVVNCWVDRSSTNHTWTASGLTVRSTAYGTGGGQVSALLADSGGAVPAGTYAARTATASASSGQAIGASLVLSP